MSTRAGKVLALTSLAIFAVFLDSTVLYVAFPSIRRSFPAVSAAELSWVLNGYSIVFAALLVASGRLADQFGRRRLFFLGAGLFTAASMLCGVAPNPAVLIVSRLLQAAGGAMLLPSSLALVLDAFPLAERAVAVTVWGAVGGLAAAVGPSLGSAVIQSLGWRWAFYLNLPVGLIAYLGGRRVLRESRDEDARGLPDFLGVLLSIAGIALIAFGIVDSENSDWLSARVSGAIVLGLALSLVFLWRSARVAAPALDLTLFRDPNFRFANAATLTFTVAFNAMYLCNILFLTQVWRYSTLQAGLAITPAPLLVMPVAVLSGRLAARFGHRPLILPGALVFAAAGLWQWIGLTPSPRYVSQWLPAMILSGAGVGLAISTLASAAVHGLPPSRYAVGSAVQGAVRQLGSVLGVAIAFALLGRAPQDAPVASFKHIFVLMILGGLLTAAFAAGIRTRPSLERRRGGK